MIKLNRVEIQLTIPISSIDTGRLLPRVTSYPVQLITLHSRSYSLVRFLVWHLRLRLPGSFLDWVFNSPRPILRSCSQIVFSNCLFRSASQNTFQGPLFGSPFEVVSAGRLFCDCVPRLRPQIASDRLLTTCSVVIVFSDRSLTSSRSRVPQNVFSGHV
jgi:hypothetical protein